MLEDFDLEATIKSVSNVSRPAITSVFLCTGGCPTGYFNCRQVTHACL